MLKVAQLKTLLQFGLMPHPELIERSFSLIQLRQESDGGAEKEKEQDFKQWETSEYKMQRSQCLTTRETAPLVLPEILTNLKAHCIYNCVDYTDGSRWNSHGLLW